MTSEPSDFREPVAEAPAEDATADPATEQRAPGPGAAATADTATGMPNEDSGREEPADEESPQVGATDGADDVGDELARARRDLAELTGDLQRLQAEFLNYKRRVDRDRDLVRENATYAALAPITEVLDTIDRARDHGPLEPGLRAVADQLERVVAGLGLTKFGAPGDPFDPTIHEALSHVGEDPAVEVTTCQVVAKAGYRINDRVVRAAQVIVVDPAAPRATGQDDQPDQDGSGADPGAGEGNDRDDQGVSPERDSGE